MGVDNVKVVNISKKRFNNLPKLALSKEIISTEATLYHFDHKNSWHKEQKLLKKFYVDEGEIFANKLETVNNLIFYRGLLDNGQLVIPDYLVSIGQELVGFTMPYIEGENLSIIMNRRETSIEDKINYLKQIGECLEKISLIRKYSTIKDFYIGDLHEQNIVVDKENNIHIIDLDSCSIAQNKPFPSRYLVSNKNLHIVANKYPKEEDLCIPSEETDLFAYNMMILNTISNGQTNKLNLEEYYEYLNYLDYLKVNPTLLDSFSKVYCYCPNVNPYESLDSLQNLDPRACLDVFKMCKRK